MLYLTGDHIATYYAISMQQNDGSFESMSIAIVFGGGRAVFYF